MLMAYLMRSDFNKILGIYARERFWLRDIFLQKKRKTGRLLYIIESVQIIIITICDPILYTITWYNQKPQKYISPQC